MCVMKTKTQQWTCAKDNGMQWHAGNRIEVECTMVVWGKYFCRNFTRWQKHRKQLGKNTSQVSYELSTKKCPLPLQTNHFTSNDSFTYFCVRGRFSAAEMATDPVVKCLNAVLVVMCHENFWLGNSSIDAQISDLAR